MKHWKLSKKTIQEITMQQSKIKTPPGDNKHLQCVVAKLSKTNKSMSLLLEQQDDALAKRRSEVATLHQACAKYKRAQLVFAQRLRNLTVTVRPAASVSTTPLPADTSTTPATPVDQPPTAEPDAEKSKPPSDIAEPERVAAVCSRCERMQDLLGDISKRSRNMSKVLDEQSERVHKTYEEESERSKKRFAEESERSRQFFAEQQASIQKNLDEDSERSRTIAAEAKEHMEVDSDVLKLKKVYQEQERIVAHLKAATMEISHRSFYIKEATNNIAFNNARE